MFIRTWVKIGYINNKLNKNKKNQEKTKSQL